MRNGWKVVCRRRQGVVENGASGLREVGERNLVNPVCYEGGRVVVTVMAVAGVGSAGHVATAAAVIGVVVGFVTARIVNELGVAAVAEIDAAGVVHELVVDVVAARIVREVAAANVDVDGIVVIAAAVVDAVGSVFENAAVVIVIAIARALCLLLRPQRALADSGVSDEAKQA